MKKSLLFVVAMLAVLIALTATAEKKLWIYSHSGNHLSIEVSDFDSLSTVAPTDITDPDPTSDPTPDSTNTVTDICGNTYPVVTIGTQTWMAENLKCNKYDTESEAYNASWLSNNVLVTSDSAAYIPYYADATDKTNWSDMYGDYSSSVSGEQTSKLGYLYNWAAAVGVDNGYDYYTIPFTGNRQGVCPNGWHVPSLAEWRILNDYIYDVQGFTITQVGQSLRTSSGWYSTGNGTDNYGFAALPAGGSYGNSVFFVGYSTYFWTATLLTDEADRNTAYNIPLRYNSSALPRGETQDKSVAQSVRCLKN